MYVSVRADDDATAKESMRCFIFLYLQKPALFLILIFLVDFTTIAKPLELTSLFGFSGIYHPKPSRVPSKDE